MKCLTCECWRTRANHPSIERFSDHTSFTSDSLVFPETPLQISIKRSMIRLSHWSKYGPLRLSYHLRKCLIILTCSALPLPPSSHCDCESASWEAPSQTGLCAVRRSGSGEAVIHSTVSKPSQTTTSLQRNGEKQLASAGERYI